MLSAQENEQLTRVGRGTPMGELQRRYWHPIGAVEELKDRYTKRVRLLGEDLVLEVRQHRQLHRPAERT
jgi:5,5'-dehydrodivanillate O-demethylase